LTILVTDNFLRRSYNELQRQLHPDTVFFLGDLFDGGREWRTLHGEFKDPEWSHRPMREISHAKSWNKKYGENYWLQEYARFGDIFFGPWNVAGGSAGPGQRGRKLIASLPGNHDLGFGSEVKLSVRDRFECYFGATNRVDVIGNHTFVSVDTVSLSADSSDRASQGDVQKIFNPVHDFLNGVQSTKKKAVAKELRYLQGKVEDPQFSHRVEDLDKADFGDLPRLSGEKGQADLPTVLLTHVPLYRAPGTPCGPMREHWPPTKPAKGQPGPVVPDHRNAITVAGGYQYQNVLGEEDSARLVSKVGNVVHAFSGDDHDYCEVTHTPNIGSVPEITVKSFSMAMGVPTPGFLMVSLHNPVDALGNPLPGAPKRTLQTHLCLLPNQISTYLRYALLGLATLGLIALRALLLPVLRLTPFALPPDHAHSPPGLPVFKAKSDDDDGRPHSHHRGSAGSGFAAAHSRDHPGSSSRRGVPSSAGPAAAAGDRWGWGAHEDRRGAPRIQIRSDDDFYDGGKWKAAQQRPPRGAGAGSGRWAVGAVGREMWTCTWRVVWMAGGFWAWLAWKG
jgi:ethanolamine phosphate phosphodiesterase